MTAAIRLASALAAFRDVDPEHTIAATAAEGGGVHRLTYGDLSALLRTLVTTEERLARVADWHARETGPAGTVGDYCTECGTRWPCDTRRIAEGIYVDEENSDA